MSNMSNELTVPDNEVKPKPIEKVYRTTSEEIDQLELALIEASKHLPLTIEKTKQGYGYKYADISDLISETKPILIEHGLLMSQGVYGNTTLFLRTRLSHPKSKQWIEDEVRLINDPQQKNILQSIGSAFTYERRYQWQALIGLSAEEDKDGNAPKPQPQSKQPQKKNAPPQKQQSAKKYPNGLTEAQLKRLFAITGKSTWQPSDVKDYIAEEFKKESSKDLTPKEYNLLCNKIMNENPPNVEFEDANEGVPPQPTEEFAPDDEETPF